VANPLPLRSHLWGRSLQAAVRLALLSSLLFLGVTGRLCAAGDVPPSAETPHLADAPRQIIEALAQRLYAIGETSGSIDEALAAEKAAADQIRAYLAHNLPEGLAEVNTAEQTPLISAVYNGYPQIVSALLESKVVQAQVGDRDSKGGTAWLYANLAIRQSVFACNPGIMNNVFAWEPLMVTQYYYLHVRENPYRAVRSALESKGGRGTLKEAKDFWIALCTHADAQTIDRIKQSRDVLDGGVAVGTEAQARFLIEMQRKLSQPANSTGATPQ